MPRMLPQNQRRKAISSQSPLPQTDILALMDTVFSRWFKGPSWASWRVLLAVLFGLHDKIDSHGLTIYKAATGRETLPVGPIRRCDICVGRRGGKSLVSAFIGVFCAFFVDYSPYLAPGESATVLLTGADKRQGQVILRYIKGFIAAIPALKGMVIAEGKEGIELSNRVSVEVRSASLAMGGRGFTLAVALNDEIAFWTVDENCSDPDKEILAAQRPAMLTIPSSLQINVSSPHARKGHLWTSYQENFGKDTPGILYWKAASRCLPEAMSVEMNSSLPLLEVQVAYEADASAAAADYGANFRTDLESLFTREAIAACVYSGRFEIPPSQGLNYFGFCDPSGGSSDSMTLGISHRDQAGKIVLDAIRERRAPFSPDAVVQEFAEVLKSYKISQVTGDRYAAEWPVERFRVHGITYQPASMTKSELYLAALPILNSGGCELLDVPRLAAQLIGLERRTARGGKDSVDHSPGAHDDIANAVCGALVAAPLIERQPWCEFLRPGPITDWGERGWTKIR